MGVGMASISYDGQSFTVDGRRIWLVSGAIHYLRTPHQLWRRRIRAAKEAGLNCIETYVFWNAHEPTPGHFDFEGDLDLRRFVQIVGEEGMWCIVRPGPYVCAEWDFGGLPPWLHNIEGIKLRQSHPAFLEACARYTCAVMEQVRDLQVTATSTPGSDRGNGNAPGDAAGGYAGQGGGPVLMMQAENEWFCHNPAEHDAYLREIVRYLRENGCTVPINNCNNLWQPVDGTLSTWNGARNLTTDMRQLAVVQPDAPRLVTEYWPGWFDQWDGEHAHGVDAELNLYRLAGILATGSQYNLYMFHGGTNFAFWGGRTVSSPACFMTTSYDYDAPLLEAGGRGAKYVATKRISTFAGQFGHLFAHLSADGPHAAIVPDESADHSPAVVHLGGAQGDVVFILRGEKDKAESVNLMLPNGLTLPVPMGDERAVWLVLDANLGGVARLNYTNLRPWAFVDRRMLVLFGPAGAPGVVGIDGAQFHVKVPTGAEPLVEKHDNLVLVVLSTGQIDHAYFFEGGLAVNAAGLDDDGQPIPASGGPMAVVDTTGKVVKRNGKPTRKPTAPRLGNWGRASLAGMVDGSDERYRPINGPAGLEALDTPYGYGWYRLGIGKTQQGKMLAPQAGDRLHVYNGGKLQKVLGLAPGAQYDPVDLKLAGDAVVLADNLGRFNYGQSMGEQKGFFGHLYKLRPARLGKPKVISERAADPFQLTGLVMHRRKGDRPPADALVWKIKPTGRKPMILDIQDLPLRGTWLVNGEPLAVYLAGASGHAARYVLTPGEGAFTGGVNELKLSLFGALDPKHQNLGDTVRLYQTTAAVTQRGAWAFAPWTVPHAEAFEKMPKVTASQPAWLRATFRVSRADTPLWFEPRGLTKGQLILNGHNVGRYFVATRTGKAVGPQKHYYLPEPWLRTDAENELLIFDEHGGNPTRSRLVYNAMGPYNKA